MGLRIPPFGSPDLSISGYANVGLFSEMKTKLLLKFLCLDFNITWLRYDHFSTKGRNNVDISLQQLPHPRPYNQEFCLIFPKNFGRNIFFAFGFFGITFC